MTISKANDCGLSYDIATIYIAYPRSEVELLLDLTISFENYHIHFLPMGYSLGLAVVNDQSAIYNAKNDY